MLKICYQDVIRDFLKGGNEARNLEATSLQIYIIQQIQNWNHDAASALQKLRILLAILDDCFDAGPLVVSTHKKDRSPMTEKFPQSLLVSGKMRREKKVNYHKPDNSFIPSSRMLSSDMKPAAHLTLTCSCSSSKMRTFCRKVSWKCSWKTRYSSLVFGEFRAGSVQMPIQPSFFFNGQQKVSMN